MIKYTEEEALNLLFDGTYCSANEMLSERLPKIEKRMNRAVKNLADLLEEVKLTFPDATFYTASGGLCLMLGASHDAKQNPQRELVALNYADIISIGDGDF